MSDASSELSEVIRGAQNGSPDCFDALVDLYAPRLYGYFYRLSGSRDDAEDLLQELFIRLVRSIKKYEHRDQWEAFLFRIASNLVRDQMRRMRRLPETASLDGSDFQSIQSHVLQTIRGQESPEQGLERFEQARELQEALRSLPHAEQDVILLRHYSNLSFQEIANMLEIPIGTALARAHRGLSKLRRNLEGASP